MKDTKDLPQVGFIGFGIVNQAVYSNLKEEVKDQCSIYSLEKEYEDEPEENLNKDIIILTVPTDHEHSLRDTLINVTSNIEFLCETNYEGTLVIKSTCLPSDINSLCKNYTGFENLKIVYWPEFLSACTATEDFMQESIILGGNLLDTDKVFRYLNQILIWPKDNYTAVTAEEAMEFKIYRNVYAMYKYVFFNNLPNLFNTDPRKLQRMLEIKPLLDSSLKIGNDGKFGVGGACLPKDNLNLIQSHKLKVLSPTGLTADTKEEFDAASILVNLDNFNRNFRDDLPER